MASPAIAADDVKLGFNNPNIREAVLRFRQGIISEPFPRNSTSTATAVTTGTVYYSLVPLFKGDIATGGAVWSTTAASGLTLVKHALFTKDGATQLAVTATDHTNYNGGAGTLVTNFTTAYSVPLDDVYLFAHVEVGTTGATLRGGPAVNTAAIGSGLRPNGTGGAGQTDIPVAPLTLVAGNPAIWFAVV